VAAFDLLLLFGFSEAAVAVGSALDVFLVEARLVEARLVGFVAEDWDLGLAAVNGAVLRLRFL